MNVICVLYANYSIGTTWDWILLVFVSDKRRNIFPVPRTLLLVVY